MRTIYYKSIFGCLFYVLFISRGINTFAQAVGSSQKSYAPNVIPPSPNSTSLGKYGELPVSIYTGIPSISIPLLEAKNKDISIPVSLSYHSSVKVEEIASLVGLGWSLNAGGMISRSIVGKPDDLPSVGYLYNSYVPDYFFSGPANSPQVGFTTLQSKYAEVENMVTGTVYDLQPDVFNFSFGGQSGKFYIDKTDLTKGFTLEKQNIFIQPIYGPGAGITTISGFNVYDGSGNKYVFGAGEVELTASYDIAGEGDFNVTSWMLKEITSSNGTKITFEYESYSNYFLTKPYEILEVRRLGQVYYVNNPDVINLRRSSNNTYVQGKQLKKIIFENGYIEFIKDVVARRDLKPECYPLKEVKLFDKSNVLIKSFKLKYGYFNETMANNSSNGYQTEGTEPVRLRLEEVQEFGNTTTKYNPPHKFTYFAGNLANRFSNSQDHWGYNNERNNTSLIPMCIGNDGATTRQFGYANRAPKESSTKIGILQKIEYPTGGSTEFDYELNESFTKEFIFPPYSFQEICPSNTEYSVLEEIQTVPNVNPTVRTNVNIASGGSYYFEVLGNPTGTVQGFYQSLGYSTRFYLKNLTTNKIIFQNYDPTYFIPVPNCTSCFPPVTYLDAGNYEIKIEIINTNDADIMNVSDAFIPFVKISMKGNSMPINVDYNKKIGGLRIKKMTTFDGIDISKNIIKEFRYNDIVDNTKSSGKLINIPNYFSSTIKEYLDISGVPIGNPAIITPPNEYFTIQNNTTAPLASTRGGTTGYKYVEVLDGLNGSNGKTQHNFTTSEDYPDIVDDVYPFTPSTDFDLNRGFEKSVTIFRKDSPTTNSKSMQTNNTEFYTMSKQYFAVLTGCRYIGYVQNVVGSILFSDKVCKDPVFEKYKIESGWIGKAVSIERTYDQSDINKVLIKNSNYEYYDETDRLLMKKVTNETGVTDPVTIGANTTQVNRKIQMLYKYPKDFAAVGNDYQAMIDRKIISPIIQEETFLIKKKTDGTDDTPIAQTFKKTSYKKWYNSVLSGSIETSPPIFAPEKIESKIRTGSLFTEITFDSYDVNGNVTGFTERNGLKNTLTYYGVADLGKLNLLKTQTNNLGHLTTYEYFPLIGVGSITDPNSRKLSYIYDALNRLSAIKDNNQKIVKSYQYNFKNQ